ncbi:GNAT family N-acetyltransferase [Ornithinimicrobium cryptoxanthini]|uniref:GNAT family N-acetyltransferase n=1 Tax=Ornithinimicrobium cryptoxanthini TaxID=2934161 RepID=A0ABY4YER9_9MICO|nr:GNAT family N-acetyltransferase [Ornithinimicrobium cryptoxanthini]USQ74853.1 GNAT family N-acetyltransferase [Ornithinimicrobium cryptoxanthini]
MSPPRSIVERAAAPQTVPAITAGGLVWRPATIDDVATLTALTNAMAKADGAPYRVTREETEDDLTAPGVDLARDTTIGVDEAGEVRAYGSVMAPPGDESTVRAFLFGGVHPARRGQGIGSEVFAWQTARARQVLAASGKELPGRLAAFAEDSDPAERHDLIKRAGFEPRRFYADLKRPLIGDAPAIPEVELAEPLRLVPFSAELDDATRLAHNDAFRDHWGSEPQTREQWVNGRSEFVPEWSFVVIDESAVEAGAPVVVAYALSSRYEADFPVRGYSFGYTDVLGTRRAYRGRKAALAALGASMRAFADGGMEAAVLDVDTENPSGAQGLYASLGYVKEHGSVMYSIEL